MPSKCLFSNSLMDKFCPSIFFPVRFWPIFNYIKLSNFPFIIDYQVMQGIILTLDSVSKPFDSVPKTYIGLLQLIQTHFPTYELSKVAYIDQDGDLVTIKSNQEYLSAFTYGRPTMNRLEFKITGTPLTRSFMTVSQLPPQPQTIPIPEQHSNHDLRQLIRQEMDSYLPKILKCMESEHSQVVHQNVACDSCNISPIVGHRYKCSICQNFDFCSKCEQNCQHPHPFIKIRTPEMAPKSIIAIQNQEAPLPRRWQKPKNRQACPQTRLLCRFVRDVVGFDGDKHPVGAEFVKTWRLRNDGKNQWPQGCQLVCVNGDFGGQPVDLPPLKPSEEENVSVHLKAPAEEGRFTSYWRAVDPENMRFGQRIWATINVVQEKYQEETNQLLEIFANKEIIRKALEESGGNADLAAELLLRYSFK